MVNYYGKATPASGQGGGGSGDAVWGAITGTLSNQTDLQDALNAKQNTLTAGSNITISNNVITATNTTYSPFTGATSQAAGSAGLVPAPTTSDVDKYLKGDGTWGAVSGGGIQNTATGTNSLTILGSASTYTNTLNVGVNTSVDGDGAIALGCGDASAYGSIAIGYDQDQGVLAQGDASIAIGIDAHANNDESIAIGTMATANHSNAIALGSGAETSDMEFAIGFGYDQNNSTYRNYVLLDGTTGKIPNERLNPVATIANQNTNVGAVNPLKVWNGTEQEWNTGGGSQTWYAWYTLDDPTAEEPQMIYVYTLSATPEIGDTIYSAPNVATEYTIQSYDDEGHLIIGTNTEEYARYNSADQTTTSSVGQAHPDYLCFINGVGVKIGTTSIVTVDQTYNASSTNAQSGVAVNSVVGAIETALQGV